MALNTRMSKPKGLKDHKKAEKEKAIAKRAAAAAEQAKSKKGSKVEKKVKTVVVQEPVAEDIVQQAVTSPTKEVAQEKKVEVTVIAEPIAKDIVTSPVDEVSQEKPVIAVVVVDQDTCEYKSAILDCALVTNTASAVVAEKIDEDISEKITIPTITVEAPSAINTIPQVIDVAAPISTDEDALAAKVAATVAHRKKLEADLYDGMETAQERFARVRRVTSATVEYHYDVVIAVDDDAVSACSLADVDELERAVDGIGIEYVTVHDVAAYTPEDAFADAVVDEVTGTHAVKLEAANKFITMDQLFCSTTTTGTCTVGASRPKSPLTLAEVEEMQAEAKAASNSSKSSSLDINQLFAADNAERTIIVRMPKAVAASTVPEITQLFAAEGAPIVRLPAAAGNSPVRAARTWACVLAGMTFGCMDEIADDANPVEPVIIGGRSRTPVDHKLIEAVVFGRPDEFEDISSEVPFPAVQGNANDKPLPADLQLGSEKLMSMLGVDGRVPTPAPTQQNGQEGADKIMALLGFPRSRTASGSSVPTPPQSSPDMNGRRSTPNTQVTVTPPPLDNHLANSNSHNFSKNDCGAWKVPNMGPSSGPYSYQQPGFGPQYATAQYVAQPCFPEYHPHGLPGFNTPFYGQWQNSRGYAPW
ncbi:hypothetical protein HBI38_210420 [Parastagonospora nodorum]|nr:hypothetical protein HBH47_002370 [Parastagonospora nodorum]KAH4605767.1 hypothetical protein HBH82_115210 [Parastagonospora nodorum]KAH4702681.1 hypothetical protein HBH67_129810 [Parastagonospora nodorum]KAH4734856.1 hypothetical protein HBH78_010090 [Parastagonospora nodorum]KAH4790906.1 hypothetical protein HBH62_030990 [Parastagonospora nodorum]